MFLVKNVLFLVKNAASLNTFASLITKTLALFNKKPRSIAGFHYKSINLEGVNQIYVSHFYLNNE
jgi:hypothetical protein